VSEVLSDWILSVEGTPAGARYAMLLALISAFSHAAFGALQKGRYDPWMARGAIDFALVALSAPIALFLVPWPSGLIWPFLGGAMVIHFVYKYLMAMAYTRGAYTLVYPVVRGTGPLAAVVFAMIVFGEQYAPLQWFGLALLSGGILCLAADNLRKTSVGRPTLIAAIGLAVLTGLIVAVYTVYDAYAIRQTPNPFTFLAWFFFLSSIDFAIIGTVMWSRAPAPPPLGPLLRRGVVGALIAFVSFGGVMLATRLDKVGEAAVLRETSVIFAVAIGWFFLKESVGFRQICIISTIALGAVLVEFGA
jgi:drug/metabolite transporter (DMT)-like permease